MNLTDEQQALEPLLSSEAESVKIADEKALAADLYNTYQPPPTAFSGTTSIWNRSPRIIWLREVFPAVWERFLHYRLHWQFSHR